MSRQASSVTADADPGVWAGRTHAGHRVPLAWVRLLAAQATLTRAMNARLLEQHGLTLNAYEVLLHLSWAPDGQVGRTELARGVHLTQGGITRLLERLERAGLVRSEASETDRRVVLARLTDAGRRRLEEAAVTHVADVSARFTERLSADELSALAELLVRVAG